MANSNVKDFWLRLSSFDVLQDWQLLTANPNRKRISAQNACINAIAQNQGRGFFLLFAGTNQGRNKGLQGICDASILLKRERRALGYSKFTLLA